MKRLTTLGAMLTVCCATLMADGNVPPVVHPQIGIEAKSADGQIHLKLVGKRQNFGGSADTRDDAINSPKSVNVHPDGKKYYVNSLEGGTTVVFEMGTNKRLKVISHHIGPEHASLWSKPSAFYQFTHYPKNNCFMGKPVESAFSHNGRYLWVPYYRRSYDINAQDPSAVAVIDTKSDEIVKLMETGPLPKMIRASRDGKLMAISHWGNNTVGLIDISSGNPGEWHHKACLTIDHVLPLNYSLTESVDRDNGSGYALRGTAFTPDNKYLLVGCMGGGGGIAVVDLQKGKYMGRVLGMMANVRHIIIVGDYLYLSINGAGYVQRIPLKKFLSAAASMKGKTCTLAGWQNCKVGKGARTIEASPSGRYIFAACNNVSQLCVVDTKQMKCICTIDVDSYPVGLDVSKDGRYVLVTSQGRSHFGGNALNIYEVEYTTPEKPLPSPADTLKSDTAAIAPKGNNNGESHKSRLPLIIGGSGSLLLLGFFAMRRKSWK